MTDGPPRPFSLAGVRAAIQGLGLLRELRGAPERLDRLLTEQRELSNRVGHELQALRRELAVLHRSHDTLALQAALSTVGPYEGVLTALPATPPVAGAPLVFAHSTICRQDHMEDPVFRYWMARLHEPPWHHRKQWEFGFICQTLFERGQLQAGQRGLGFGVGEEPLSALFASYGCEVTGTDQSFDEAVATGWTATDQHAAGKAALSKPWICDPAEFDRLVSFQSADMNAIPDTLRGFDFCWSACALEHLGSIRHGLEFIEASLETLKPGGFAIHTTEFNISSNEDTVDDAGTVLFRRRDLEGLARDLNAKGHRVSAFDWNVGDRPMDRFIDVPPYRPNPHLRLLLEGYAVTSVGVIVQKAP